MIRQAMETAFEMTQSALDAIEQHQSGQRDPRIDTVIKALFLGSGEDLETWQYKSLNSKCLPYL